MTTKKMAIRVLFSGLLMCLALALLAPVGSLKQLVRLRANAVGNPLPTTTTPTMVGTPAKKQQVIDNYGKLPLIFEANQGQTDAQVKFMSRGSGYQLYLTPTEAVLSLRKGKVNANTLGNQMARRDLAKTPGLRGRMEKEPTAAQPTTVRMKLVGGNEKAEVAGVEQQSTTVNYFISNDQAKWQTAVPTYARVRYTDVYPGVDLAYYGNQKQLEYDFVVKPGADPNQIRLRFQGANRIRIDASGDLVLTTKGGEVRQNKPVVYQEVAGRRTEITASYLLQTNREVRFEIGNYDNRQPLVIDPILRYSTYLGGSLGDYAFGIAVDSAGNAYIAGIAESVNFPTLNAHQATYGGGFRDAFVTKLTASGQLAYSTFLGGANWDEGFGIAVDSAGSAYVAGITNSTNFPTLNAFQPSFAGGGIDAFVTKLNAAGTLSYSTYLGGSGVNGDGAYGIAVDSGGNAYITGFTNSTNFPTLNAYQQSHAAIGRDAFVTKLGPTGGLSYSTYLGGNSEDVGRGIAVDSANNAYLTGWTQSIDFPILNAYQFSNGGNSDVFITRMNADGGLSYSTYLGGNDFDYGYGIAVDFAGNAYVTGDTNSMDFPIMGAYQGSPGGALDAFVTKLSASGGMSYSTYLGGASDDGGTAIAVDSAEQPYVTGATRSTNFPTLHAYQSSIGSTFENDAFVTRLTEGGGLSYSTYLGGQNSDLGNGIAVDAPGDAYVTGRTSSLNFPILNAYQSSSSGNYVAFITKLGDAVCSSDLSTSGSVPDFCETSSQPINLSLNGTDLADSKITWSLTGPSPNPNLGTGTNLSITLSGLPAGSYTITATATNPDCPDVLASQNFTVEDYTPASAGPDAVFCETSITALAGNSPAAGTGSWTLLSGTATISNPTNPTSGVTDLGYGDNVFRWTITNGSCSSSDEVTLTRHQLPSTANAGSDQAFCELTTAMMTANTPTAGMGTWTLVSGTGTINQPNNPTTVISNLGYGPNVFRWIISNGSCVSSSDDVVITRDFCPTNITLSSNSDSFLRSGSDDTNEGANERLRIQSSGNNRVVVGFDLTGISTVGLQSATLILNIAENSNNWGTSGRLVDAHRLLVDWTEGNGRNDVMVGGGPGFRGTGEGVTWHCGNDTNIVNQVPNCSPLWNGGSYSAATAPSVLHINGFLGEVSWDVTADVLAGANFGWLIRKQNEGQNGQVRYYSREGAALAGDLNLGPRLVLIYSP